MAMIRTPEGKKPVEAPVAVEAKAPAVKLVSISMLPSDVDLFKKILAIARSGFPDSGVKSLAAKLESQL
jgi:hypothetical protein